MLHLMDVTPGKSFWPGAINGGNQALVAVGANYYRLPLQLAGFFTGPLTGYLWLPAFVFAPVLGLWLLIKGVHERG